MDAVPNAARVAAYRYGAALRLMRNICMWKDILAMPVLEKIALDQLLSAKILPHLRSMQSNVHDAIYRSERLVTSLSDVWSGPTVTGDKSRKPLESFVDYLLSVGRRLSGGPENETGYKLARRLKKMLVDLNEYDEARAISRTFKLKEAL
ncbi:hypothetical protein M569_01727 [Genlisea aurea]|uniref:Uncharacterized protein n=1 Tax=Genlisea aurea TaxID=192259 RepID=S8CZU8_9LAMI|nr:hypothetical protein M569_01727 [Genlisea aurea]